MTRKTNPKTKFIIILSLALAALFFIFLIMYISKEPEKENKSTATVTESTVKAIDTTECPYTEAFEESTERKSKTKDKLSVDSSDSSKADIKESEKREKTDNTTKNYKEKYTEIENMERQTKDTENINIIEYNQCPNVTTNKNNTDSKENIRINYKKVTVRRYYFLSLQLNGADENVIWDSENPTVIRKYFTNGNRCTFKAMALGSARIYAKYNNKKYYCDVTVE